MAPAQRGGQSRLGLICSLSVMGSLCATVASWHSLAGVNQHRCIGFNGALLTPTALVALHGFTPAEKLALWVESLSRRPRGGAVNFLCSTESRRMVRHQLERVYPQACAALPLLGPSGQPAPLHVLPSTPPTRPSWRVSMEQCTLEAFHPLEGAG